MNLKLRKFTKS